MRVRNNGRGLLITSGYKSWKMRLASYLDSQQSRKTAAVIVKRGKPLGLLLFVVGLAVLYMLPKDEFNRKSFFDENALLAGLAKREFRNQNSIGAFAKELQNIGHNDVEAVKWLEIQFARLGMETYSQNFTATRPVSFETESPKVSGTNVYGILRAGRARSTEAIVLSAPFPSRSSLESNNYGIALVLALAEYSRAKTYWAKDIVFLVTTHDELGMQAWINAYMGLQTANIAAAPLAGRSGAIQAVINLELPTAAVQYADIVIDGVNGILPNLDLVNVVVHLCESEGIPTSFHTQSELHSHRSQSNQHRHALLTVFAIATHQAPGLPLANHGLFLRHRIDSLTVRGVGTMAANQQSRSLVNLARALEGSLRSINNLLETLHHSEFFYFTSSRRHFISIGLYMPPLGLLLAPLALEMLSQWLLARIPGLLEGNPAKDATGLPVRVPFPFQAVVKLLLLSFTSGLVLYAAPSLASLLQHPLKAEGMVASLLGVCGVSIVVPLFFRSLVDSSSWRMAKSFGLLVLLLLVTAVAMMNYSLAFFLVLALLPPAVLAQPWGTSGKLPQVLRMAVVLLSSPPLCLLYCCTVYRYLFSSAPTDTPFDTVTAAANMAFTGVVFAYNSWHFVGSWISAVVCLLVWPMWLSSWIQCCQNSHKSSSDTTGFSHLHSD